MRPGIARRSGVLGLAAAAALVAGVGPAAAETGGASAYGASVDVTPLGENAVHAGPLAAASTRAGPDDGQHLVSVTAPGVLSMEVINVGAHRNAVTGEVRAAASTAVVTVPLLNALGWAGADAVEASCDATQQGIKLATTLVNASLGTSGALGVHPAPNTVISIGPPDGGTVATVILNEQADNPDGSRTVNAVHIRLLGSGAPDPIGTGDVVISSATCGPAALPIPMASGAGLWFGLGLAGAAVPAGLVIGRRRLRRRAATIAG